MKLTSNNQKIERKLKFSIDDSRIVGLVDEILIPELAVKLGLAIGTFFGKKSVIATSRDHRSDSHMIKRALSGGLMATGVDILDLHAAPTSTLEFIVRRFGCDGGLSFTGGHYLDGETSIRILDGSGNELEKTDLEKITEIAELGTYRRVKKNEIGTIEPIENAMEVYKNALATFIDKKVFINKNFRVVLDLSLGPASLSVPAVFSELNIDIISINSHRSNIINKEGVLFPNPLSLKRVSDSVKAVNADIGAIIDVEGVKVVFVDDKGKIYLPEDTAAFLIYQSLKKRQGNIILSELFTRQFDEIIKSVGGQIIRATDLPGDIGRLLNSERAVIGATDNGKIYNPIWGAETDGALSTLTLLSILALNRRSLSDMMQEFEGMKSKAEIVSRMESNLTLPDNFSQLDFFRAVRHKRNFHVRDSLIGIKFTGEKGGICHFYVGSGEREIKVLVEMNDPSKVEAYLDHCLELAKDVIQSQK